MSETTITITKIDAWEKKSRVSFTTTVDGEDKPGSAYAWNDSIAGWAIGEVKSVSFEQKPSYKDPSVKETWIVRPKTGGSGGGFRGGGAKADPERTAVAKEANEIRREDGKRIKECFDEKQSAIMAQVAVKEAGETYRSLNLPDWDANKFDGMAVDIMDTLNGLVKRDKDGTNVQQ